MAASTLTDLRQEQLRHDEARVLAEEALRAERTIAWLRLGVGLSMGVAVAIARALQHDGATQVHDPVRAIAAAGYVLFALLAAVMVRRAKPSPKQETIAPMLSSLADFSFVTFMTVRRWTHGGVYAPETLLALDAVFVAFAVARYSTWLVAYSTGLGLVGFFFVEWYVNGLSRPLSLAFGTVTLLAIGVVIGNANRAVRRMFVDLRRRDNLARFLPKQVAERVLRLGGAPLEPVSREVSILFTDIRDFTTLSEKAAPRELLEFLNGFLGELSQIVKGRDGMVNKYLGDGLLAVWGVPEHDERHAQNAVRAALDMLRRVDALNAERARDGQPPVRIGIGVHTGPVAAGMIGGADQHEYTVIGDAVNLASRVEGLTKTYGCPLLVTAPTWRRISPEFRGRPAGETQVKGRSEPVAVFAVEGSAQDAPQEQVA